jgi:glutaredoxin
MACTGLNNIIKVVKMTLYTTGCPKCLVLERMLKEANFDYRMENRTDKVLEAAQKAGVAEVPFMISNDGVFYNFYEAIRLVKDSQVVQ